MNQRQEVISTVFLATEKRMDILFMSMIPFSGEHAPSNEIINIRKPVSGVIEAEVGSAELGLGRG